MSKITTRSRFFYGTTVTQQNRSIDFDEGSGEIQATLKVGAYSLTEYAAEWQRALREAGTQAYLVTLNRTTQKLTISAPSAFTLLSDTGSRVGTGAWDMAGIDTSADIVVNTSHTAANIAGERYDTQYPVNEYLAFDDNEVKESGVVSSTPAGIVQQIYFGDGARCEMNIRLITNQNLKCTSPFGYNPNGVSDAKAFLSYLLTKGKVEFMPDLSAPASFFTCYLERTQQDQNALRHQFENMQTPDVYQTGVLTFREILQ